MTPTLIIELQIYIAVDIKDRQVDTQLKGYPKSGLIGDKYQEGLKCDRTTMRIHCKKYSFGIHHLQLTNGRLQTAPTYLSPVGTGLHRFIIIKSSALTVVKRIHAKHRIVAMKLRRMFLYCDDDVTELVETRLRLIPATSTYLVSLINQSKLMPICSTLLTQC